jgi:flagellar hook capping protein FlgD
MVVGGVAGKCGTFHLTGTWVHTGGGGCPVLDTRAADGWQIENTILSRSSTNSLALDAYRLKVTPVTVAGGVEIRVRENEQEYTRLDAAQLVAVDHAADVSAFAIGNRVLLGTRVAASRLTTSAGVDITESVGGTSDRFYLGHGGDTLLVEMMPSHVAGAVGAQAVEDGGDPGEMEGDPKETEAPQMGGRRARPTGAIDEDILSSTGILVQKPNGQGGWRTVTRYYPRRYRDGCVIDSLGTGTVRLVFVGTHRLRFIGRVARSEEQASIQSLTLTSADHSRLGDVKSSVEQIGGGWTDFAPGDTLTLGFATTPVPRGGVRDWFLLTTGVYSSTAMPASNRPLSPKPESPTQFALRQNHPNPFSGRTTIYFELPVDAQVTLDVFDAQGRLVRSLADGQFPAGFHALDWDERDGTGRQVGSGVYLYRIQAGAFRDQKKMVLLPH